MSVLLLLDFDLHLKLVFFGSWVTSDADRLGLDSAMRWIVGGRAVAKATASISRAGI